MFQSSKTLVELIECGQTDAWLSMELMFHLSVLPLTLQLTNISGNLWGKTLQGSRAQRTEYYLLHTFHSRKYILPDKISQQKQRRVVQPTLVDWFLEPKKGLYDKYVLLLDFNSLYPSIIQEYNICFTTVPRSEDGVPRLPSSQTPGVLPKLMEHLVSLRKRVKQKMKKETGVKYWELDIRQQALKLTANRFYAKPLAELITLQGREILQRTVDLVQNHLNLEVIYGDTDSIMIHSGLDDIEEVKTIITKVIQEVNKKYRCMKIECDGIYKRMLILRKKKYAGVKLQFKDGKTCEDTKRIGPMQEIERKGVDMVRPDWSLLSKEIGDLCLAKIFYGGSCEDVVEAIHNELIKEEMRNGPVALEKYVITKALSKSPEAYPDSKSQPHVQVALRMRQHGFKKVSVLRILYLI
ncbi:DNA polymerase alpha catalytic subunit [Raphanus sativus]|nr:DNA polymerase alpha catalytic subunit [Raphanus sativus]